MSDRSYIGIDRNGNNEWVVALCGKERNVFSRPFKNTPSDLAELIRFISEQGPRPKICLNPTTASALRLIKSIGGIPDAEVLLISEAGLRVHQGWLPKSDASYCQDGMAQAFLLARCAERIA